MDFPPVNGTLNRNQPLRAVVASAVQIVETYSLFVSRRSPANMHGVK